MESCNKSEIPESNPTRGILDLCVRGVWSLVTKVRFRNPTRTRGILDLCVQGVCAAWHGPIIIIIFLIYFVGPWENRSNKLLEVLPFIRTGRGRATVFVIPCFFGGQMYYRLILLI